MYNILGVLNMMDANVPWVAIDLHYSITKHGPDYSRDQTAAQWGEMSFAINVQNMTTGLWFLRIFPDFRIVYKSPFDSKCSWKKRSSHQGKKEVHVACIVSKPLDSCLWGCGESLNCPPDQRETQARYPFFRICYCQITPLLQIINRTCIVL